MLQDLTISLMSAAGGCPGWRPLAIFLLSLLCWSSSCLLTLVLTVFSLTGPHLSATEPGYSGYRA